MLVPFPFFAPNFVLNCLERDNFIFIRKFLQDTAGPKMAKKEMRIKKKEMVYGSQKGVLKVRKLLSLQGHICAHVDQLDPPDHLFSL